MLCNLFCCCLVIQTQYVMSMRYQILQHGQRLHNLMYAAMAAKTLISTLRSCPSSHLRGGSSLDGDLCRLQLRLKQQLIRTTRACHWRPAQPTYLANRSLCHSRN
ncbi:hypothetical protein IWX46DRAFT_213970 [Phyllosticta citricarpa]|uniref:Secreted protein n=1 Tax=Phyllosticta citricarpa TaxID=55181 RepID=A0ABR1MMZ4_9PEZI